MNATIEQPDWLTYSEAENQKHRDFVEAQHETEITALEVCIAGESHSDADVVEWRDAFCHSCADDPNSNGHEYLNGTARELAEKVRGLGWELNAKGNLVCVDCINAEEDFSDWART